MGIIITVHGIVLIAALCPHGCKVYPVSSLALHMLQHDRLDAGLTASHGWNENRPGRTHVGNKNGRPRMRDSEKVHKRGIRLEGKGAYRRK
jgi:hypothetical protein